MNKKLLWISIVFLLQIDASLAQYAPAAGFPGSTAIAFDSSAVAYWAQDVEIYRGPRNIAQPELGDATYGEPADALGPADLLVVSLGDGGIADFYFNPPLFNQPGHDFAVFENSFSDLFLELCFVEVSSDGENFFRFPSVSKTPVDEQVGAFSTLNPTELYNLGGKYRGGFGTPFDLEELANIEGLDIDHIQVVRLIDAVGSIDEAFSTTDSEGNIINDPWPTDFESGGFDLDALAVLLPQNSLEKPIESSHQLFPQPFTNVLHLQLAEPVTESARFALFNTAGQLVWEQTLYSGTQSTTMNLSNLTEGIYIYRIDSEQKTISGKVVKTLSH